MAFKDQTQCYRTIKGVRWPNFCDILEDYHQDDVDAFKAWGGRIAIRTHPEGYKQAFAHPDDLAQWNRKGDQS
jgi:hypothetical protein